MPVSVSIESLAQDYDGYITYVSPAMDDTTKTYVVRITLAQPDAKLRGGMFAQSSIDVLQTGYPVHPQRRLDGTGWEGSGLRHQA